MPDDAARLRDEYHAAIYLQLSHECGFTASSWFIVGNLLVVFWRLHIGRPTLVQSASPYQGEHISHLIVAILLHSVAVQSGVRVKHELSPLSYFCRCEVMLNPKSYNHRWVHTHFCYHVISSTTLFLMHCCICYNVTSATTLRLLLHYVCYYFTPAYCASAATEVVWLLVLASIPIDVSEYLVAGLIPNTTPGPHSWCNTSGPRVCSIWSVDTVHAWVSPKSRLYQHYGEQLEKQCCKLAPVYSCW